MFENIGLKIKELVKILCIVGVVFCCLLGLLIIFLGTTQDGGQITFNMISVVTGLLVAIVGSLSVWVSCFFAYAFGEIAEQSMQQTRLLYRLIGNHNAKLSDKPDETSDTV